MMVYFEKKCSIAIGKPEALFFLNVFFEFYIIFEDDYIADKFLFV